MFPMKKVEGCAKTWCDIGSKYKDCGKGCSCLAWGIFGGTCLDGLFKKAVREVYNVCESDDDCIKKGSGSICAYYPNSELQHGWCFNSNVEAERYFEVLSNPAVQKFFKKITHSNEKEFLKMALDNIAT
ncbi:albumin [Trifolium medium]|uniref:Albumin n=1 Tax=Trifolium medium TaxID=97028 RepID=A0A392NR05_9FABA|nr:albumin [Trifolium medium]